MKDFKKWIWVYLIGAFVILSIALIISIALESNRLRHFKTDLFVLTHESDVCVAEGPDGRVRVNSDNWVTVYSIIEKLHGNLNITPHEPVDTVTFYFDCHNEEWTLLVEEISDSKLILRLEGPRSYVVHVVNNGNFDNFKKAAAIDSFNAKNKPF